MSTAETHGLTALEYLSIEGDSDVRHEFFDGEMSAMSGGSLWHNIMLSDPTEKYDRGITFGHYRRLSTLREYVLVAQDRVSVEAYLRRPEEADGVGNIDHWLLSAATDPAATLRLGSLDVSVPLTAIYEGVEFPKAG